jgi:hypothetical protein
MLSHVPRRKFVIAAIFPSRTPFICVHNGAQAPNLHAPLFGYFNCGNRALCGETKPKACHAMDTLLMRCEYAAAHAVFRDNHAP